jgi:transcriptional regulator with GAF, ATPase, and Fis domain
MTPANAPRVKLPRLKARLDDYEVKREVRRQELVDALLAADGNVTATATALELSRQRVTVLMKELSLTEPARQMRRAANQRSR